MRVAVVTTSYPDFPGDPSGHFVQAEVSTLKDAGHDVEVIAPKAGGAFGWPGIAARVKAFPPRLLEVGSFVSRARAVVEHRVNDLPKPIAQKIAAFLGIKLRPTAAR